MLSPSGGSNPPLPARPASLAQARQAANRREPSENLKATRTAPNNVPAIEALRVPESRRLSPQEGSAMTSTATRLGLHRRLATVVAAMSLLGASLIAQGVSAPTAAH